MRIDDRCIECLYKKEIETHSQELYLNKIKDIIDHKTEQDTSPYIAYCFDRAYLELYGHRDPIHTGYEEINKSFNDLVLSLESKIKEKIKESEDPFMTSLFLARVGNYIDFGALEHVDEQQFIDLLFHLDIHHRDLETYESFKKQCETASTFLLCADNCGEIVLDRYFIEELVKQYPNIHPYVLVREDEINNDATRMDALYAGIDQVATVLTNGAPVAGTVYSLLGKETKEIFDQADIILAKGMGNYESLSNMGFHVFFSFLCKCEVFASRFNVDRFTGMFIEEM